MTTNEDRGQEIQTRLDRMGLSARGFWEKSGKIVDRSTIGKALSGDPAVRASTYGKIEAALDRLWAEIGMDQPGIVDGAESTQNGLVEFDVSGDFGVHVVVKGPVSDREELEKSVLRLVRQMRASDRGDDAASTTE